MGSGRLDGQAPQQTVLERIESQALQQATGDIPAYFSNGISSKDASDLTALMAECVSLYAGVSHTKPRIVLAVLDETAWAGLKGPAPYGLPHHTWTETPYVVIVPSTWANVPPVFATTRKHLVDALGANGVDVYIRLIALHEVGHVLTYAILNQGPPSVASRFPIWYQEFLANYFAHSCAARLRPSVADLNRRGTEALRTMPSPMFTTIDEWQTLLTSKTDAGLPLLATDAGSTNFMWYQGWAYEMAARLYEAGIGDRMASILRQQWARDAKPSTAELLKDFADVVPKWSEWLGEQRLK
jgi:hypothetical protein